MRPSKASALRATAGHNSPKALSPTPLAPADRIGQLYRAQSLINDAVARATDFKALCDQVCRIGVEEGGIACVLVRLHDTATDLLTPVAFSGPHTGFIGRPQLPAHDSQGVSAIAFQTKQRVVIDDMLVSPITAHVASEVAKQLDINSAAAFPLISAGKPIGTFAMFAEGSGFFDAALADLLEQTAAILAFSHEKLQADAARLKAEERLRLAMSASQSGVWDWDLKTGTSFLSDEYYRMFGYEPGESEGNIDFLMSLIPPENREKTLASLKAQWSSGVARTDYEQRFLCKDGSLKWVQIRATIIRAADGTAERMVGTTIDLTERKDRERRIRQLSRLNAALGKINAAVARVTDFGKLAHDACNIVVEEVGFVSAVIRKFDAAAEELTLIATGGATDGFLGRIGSIRVAESRGISIRAFQQRQPIIVHDVATDPITAHAAANGQRLGVRTGASFPLMLGEVAFGTMTVWGRDADHIDPQHLDLLQQMVDAVAFAHSKLMADAALIARERDMKLAQQAGNIGSVIIDLESARWTTSEVGFTVLGLPPADWYPLATFEALLVPAERARQIATIRANIASGKPRRPDYEIIRPADGARRWLRLITKSEFDSAGKAVRRIGTLQDVTDEHVAKQRIERANRLYDALSKTNEAVARATDFAMLSAIACRIAVEDGGMRTAVIRQYNPDTRTLNRLAHFGATSGRVGAESLSVDELVGPSVDAFRLGHLVLTDSADPHSSSLSADAIKLGLTAAASYPLSHNGNVFGIFSVFAADVQVFEEATVGLLQKITDAISFGHEKLLAQQRIERTSRLYAALSKTNEAIGRGTEFEAVTEHVCKIAVEEGGMTTAAVRLYDKTGNVLRRIAHAGVNFGSIGGELLPMEPHDGLAVDAFHHGHPVQASDLNRVQSPLGQEAAAAGLTAAVSYPLHDSRDQSIGTFTVFASHVQAFDGETAGLLQEIATALSFAWNKYQSDAALLASRRDLEVSQEVGRIGSVVIDLQSAKWTTSEVGYAVLGLPPADWYPLATFEAMLAPQRRAAEMAIMRANIASGEPSRQDYEIIRPADGAQRWLRVISGSEFDNAGKPIRRIGTLQDVTEEHLARQRIERTSRLYAALSKANEAVARSSNFETLAGIACTITVEQGGLATAVIRLHDAAAKNLRRIAHAGVRFGAIGGDVLPMEPPDGLAVDAFLHGHPVQASDLNQVQSPLGREAAQAGLTAAVSHPLLDTTGQPIGTYTVYASDVQAFDDETVRLLQELSAALSFAWTKYQADAALVTSRRDLEVAQEAGRIGSAIFDVREDTYTCSPVTCQIIGLTEPGPHAISTLLQMLSASSRKEALDNLSKHRHTTETSDHVYEIEHQLDHQPRWIRLILAGERDPTGEVLRRIGTVQDVTRQYLSERRANLLARLYSALSETNAAIVRAASFAALCRTVCQIVVERGGLVSAAIRLLDDDGKLLVEIAGHGPRAGLGARTTIPLDDRRGVGIAAFHARKPVLIAKLADDPRTAETAAAAAEIGVASAAAFPLFAQGEVSGILSVWALDSAWLDKQVSTLLAEIAEAVSFARAKLDADARLAASARDLEHAQEAGRIGSVIHDVNAGTWTCSQVACHILGLPDIQPRPLAGFLQMLRPASRTRAIESNRLRQDAAERSDEVYEIEHQQDQKTRWIRLILAGERNPSGEVLRRIGTVQDVTREHLLARRAMHLSRLYSALSETNAAIVHSPNFAELCRQVVRTLVERGGLVSAAIRLLNDDGKQLVEIAGCGPRAGLVARTKIPVDDQRGVALAAFHARKAVLIADMADDPRTVETAAAAAEIGITSAAAFPLFVQGKLFGVFSVWASDSGWLDDQMSALLAEIAETISFAHAKLEADSRIVASERDLLLAQRMGRVGSMQHDLRTDLWTVSEVGAEILGLATTGPHDMAQWKALFQAGTVDTGDIAYATMRANIASNASTTTRYHFRRLTDNQARWLLARVSTECAADGTPLRRVGTIQDVTDDVIARQRIERLSQLYGALSKTNEAVVRSENYESLSGEVCRIIVEEGKLTSAVIRLYHPESQELVEVAAHGPRTGALGRHAVPVNDPHGLAVLAFRHGRRIVVTNVDEHPSTRHAHDDSRASGIVAGAAFPLRVGEEPIGTLTVFAGHSEAFDDQMADLIGEIADSVAFARAKLASEQAHRDADARMGAIIDSAMDAIVTCDETLRILVFNDAAQRMFRMSEADAIGQSLNRLIPERFHADHPRWMASFGNQPVTSRAMGRLAQVSALRSDGNEFPVEASISHTDVSGRRLYTVIMRDVTAKLANQRALAETERRYRSLVETSLNGVMLLRSDIVVYANPAIAQILGFDDVVGVTGLNVDTLTVPEHIEAVRREIARLMQRAGGTMQPQLLRLQRRDGRLIETQATANSINVEGETLIQLELRDITTERRALAELKVFAETLEAKVEERTTQLSHANGELAAANRDLESFSYSVAHDLRAPLRAMIGFSQLLEMDLEEGTFDQLPSHTQRISDSAKRMNELIDGLLAVARVTHGALTETEIDCNVLVAEVIASLAVPESVQLAVEHLPVMKGDVPSMRQVWVNLISNAVKYSAKRPQPRIEVGVVRTEGEYWFHVRDNGAGFDAAYADRLFGVFQRLHSQDQFEGTGVGLAIVRRVIERHGGRVWAEGRPNEGATFYFALPHTRLIDA